MASYPVDVTEKSSYSKDQIIPQDVSYKNLQTEEMVIPGLWHSTPVTVRQKKDHLNPDVLIDELQLMAWYPPPSIGYQEKTLVSPKEKKKSETPLCMKVPDSFFILE